MLSKTEISSNFWSDKHVFITGATGFVGSWLVKKLLSYGSYVVTLVRDADPQSELFRSGDINKVYVVNGKIEDYLTLERAINEHEIDTVFHLAAQPIVGVALRYPLQTFESNIRGSYNLLEACRTHSQFVKRVVIASSDKAYGDQINLPYTEDMPLQGQFPYEVSKSCTDLISQCYHKTYQLPVAIARCGNIYGGGDLNWSRIIPGTIRSLLQGKAPIIRSDGKFVRDYIFIDDVIDAYLILAERLNDWQVTGNAFNFSPERPVSVGEITEIIRRIMNRMELEPIILNNVTHEIRSQYLSSKKANVILGWKPSYSIDQGINSTINWYKDFLKNDKSATD